MTTRAPLIALAVCRAAGNRSRVPVPLPRVARGPARHRRAGTRDHAAPPVAAAAAHHPPRARPQRPRPPRACAGSARPHPASSAAKLEALGLLNAATALFVQNELADGPGR